MRFFSKLWILVPFPHIPKKHELLFLQENLSGCLTFDCFYSPQRTWTLIPFSNISSQLRLSLFLRRFQKISMVIPTRIPLKSLFHITSTGSFENVMFDTFHVHSLRFHPSGWFVITPWPLRALLFWMALIGSSHYPKGWNFLGKCETVTKNMVLQKGSWK